jgi:uncharacterized membrane protein
LGIRRAFRHHHDRLYAEHEYEVNLKAEVEIMLLHEKIDGLREQQWQGLVDLQNEELALLRTLLGKDST